MQIEIPVLFQQEFDQMIAERSAPPAKQSEEQRKIKNREQRYLEALKILFELERIGYYTMQREDKSEDDPNTQIENRFIQFVVKAQNGEFILESSTTEEEKAIQVFLLKRRIHKSGLLPIKK